MKVISLSLIKDMTLQNLVGGQAVTLNIGKGKSILIEKESLSVTIKSINSGTSGIIL